VGAFIDRPTWYSCGGFRERGEPCHSLEEFDLSGVTTYPLAKRPSKVKAEDFAKPHVKGSGASAFLDSLPNILGAADFKAVVRAIVEARRSGGGIIWGFGAHVLKTGLSPILVDLAERGFVRRLPTNGAGIIHDFRDRAGRPRPPRRRRSASALPVRYG
jgi:hypothetical protein